MNPWIIIAALWLPLSALAAITIGPWIRGPHAPAPPPSASPSGGGTGPHPVPGQQDPPSAHGRRAPRPVPAPGHDCGRAVFGIVIYDGECAYALNPRTGQWRRANHCGRTDFDVAEWEAKL